MSKNVFNYWKENSILRAKIRNIKLKNKLKELECEKE